MVFSKRERIFIAVTVLALALLGLDRYALAPLLDRYGQAKVRRDSVEAEMAQARILLKRGKLLASRWRQMTSHGLTRDAAEAESQALHAIRDWAVEAGLVLSSLRPERSREVAELREITVHAAGTGSMRAVSRFLWLAETREIPIKVKMLQLGARKEGTDSLTLQLRLSTLYMDTSAQADGQRGGES